MASRDTASHFRVAPQYQEILRRVGLDADEVFTHPDIRVWRSIPERENCTLDTTYDDGRPIRLHIKRYRAGGGSAADEEAAGIQLLQSQGIPTVPLVGWGDLPDGRNFLITQDLAGYRPADKLVAEGLSFARLLEPTADLAARLHGVGLHHRDLYLCHFFVRLDGGSIDLRLIDAARVRALPSWPFRNRWIIKDLAQFWYSAQRLGISQELFATWLERYARQRQIASTTRLLRAIQRKARRIARHDAALARKQPTRNVSIPPNA